jgi:hypothetical protein
MKRLYLPCFLLFVAFSFSCKKFIQQQEEKAVMSIITNGNWYVTVYLQDGNDITSTFSGYLFKFDANGIVTGSNTGLGVSDKGSWTPDIAAKTITSGFPTAAPPVSFLDGVWKINDSGTDFVLANYTDTINHRVDVLRLQKQ